MTYTDICTTIHSNVQLQMQCTLINTLNKLFTCEKQLNFGKTVLFGPLLSMLPISNCGYWYYQ